MRPNKDGYIVTNNYGKNFRNFIEQHEKDAVKLYDENFGRISFDHSIRCFDVRIILIDGVQSLPKSMITFQKVETVDISLSCINQSFDILLKLGNCKKIIIANSIIFEDSIFADKDFKNKINNIELELNNCTII